MQGKDLRRDDVANSPVVYEWQKAICQADAFLVVLYLGDEDAVKYILIVVFVRKLHEKFFAFFLPRKFFCKLAKHGYSYAYDAFLMHSWD